MVKLLSEQAALYNNALDTEMHTAISNAANSNRHDVTVAEQIHNAASSFKQLKHQLSVRALPSMFYHCQILKVAMFQVQFDVKGKLYTFLSGG